MSTTKPHSAYTHFPVNQLAVNWRIFFSSCTNSQRPLYRVQSIDCLSAVHRLDSDRWLWHPLNVQYSTVASLKRRRKGRDTLSFSKSSVFFPNAIFVSSLFWTCFPRVTLLGKEKSVRPAYSPWNEQSKLN